MQGCFVFKLIDLVYWQTSCQKPKILQSKTSLQFCDLVAAIFNEAFCMHNKVGVMITQTIPRHCLKYFIWLGFYCPTIEKSAATSTLKYEHNPYAIRGCMLVANNLMSFSKIQQLGKEIRQAKISHANKRCMNMEILQQPFI